jgi:hypothetical protein
MFAATEASLTTTAKLEAMALAVSCAVRTCAARSPLPRTSSSSVPCSCWMTLRPGCSGGTRLMPLPAARMARKGPLASLIQPSAPVRSVLPGPITSPRAGARGRAPGSASTTLAAPAVSTTSHSSAPSPAVCQALAGGLSKTVSLAVRSPAAAPAAIPATEAAIRGAVQVSARRPPVRRRQGIVGGIERGPVCVGCRDRMATRTQMQSAGEARGACNQGKNRRPRRLSGLRPAAPAGGEGERRRI